MAANSRTSRTAQAIPARTEEVVRDVHPWRSVVLAPIGDGRRRRRGSDAVRLILSALAVLCVVLVVRTNPHPEIVVQRVLSPAPDGVRWLVDLVWILGSFGSIVI